MDSAKNLSVLADIYLSQTLQFGGFFIAFPRLCGYIDSDLN
jgi:hypothetical protein